MGRPRQRVCLQEGLSLNLPRLIRKHFITPECRSGPHYIRWSYTYTEEQIACGVLVSDLTDPFYGWLTIQVGDLNQGIDLERLPRHFGGGQWYFRCPFKHLRCTVLWLPPGARGFGSRQTWGRQVSYSSQFQGRYDRALTKAQALRASLGGPAWAGIDELDPPKPKWMRWRTYQRIVDRSRRLENIADERIFYLAKQWGNLS